MKEHLTKVSTLALASVLLLGSGFTTAHQVAASAFDTSNPQTAFINNEKALVSKIAKKYNLYASLMLAQAALESNFGQSKLSTSGNNYFGVKGSYNGQSVAMKTTEYRNGRAYQTTANFKNYPTPEASFEDYAQLLRNGLIGNANFYSGSWKENADSVSDAAKSLVGKYATDPTYDTKILNIIAKYNLASLDNGITVESNNVANGGSNANSETASDVSVADVDTTSSASTSSNNSSTNNNQYTANSTVKTKVKYTTGALQPVQLATNYLQSSLYRKVPGTTITKNPSLTWNANTISKRKSVYMDKKGIDKNNGVWYRIRATKSGKPYWVQAAALHFPAFYFHRISGMVANDQIQQTVAYNHILSTGGAIATSVKNAIPKDGTGYQANLIAIDKDDPTNSWLRYQTQDGHRAWVKLSAQKTAQILTVNTQKTLSNDYQSYHLYGTFPDTKTGTSLDWSTLPSANVGQIKVTAVAVRFSDQTVWNEIAVNGHKYWVSAKALN